MVARSHTKCNSFGCELSKLSCESSTLLDYCTLNVFWYEICSWCCFYVLVHTYDANANANWMQMQTQENTRVNYCNANANASADARTGNIFIFFAPGQRILKYKRKKKRRLLATTASLVRHLGKTLPLRVRILPSLRLRSTCERIFHLRRTCNREPLIKVLTKF